MRWALLPLKRQAPIETATIRGLLRNLQNEFVRLGRGAPQEPHPSPARAHAHDLYRPLVRPPRRLNSGTSEILEPPWLTVQVENRAVVGGPAVGLDAVQREHLALGVALDPNGQALEWSAARERGSGRIHLPGSGSALQALSETGCRKQRRYQQNAHGFVTCDLAHVIFRAPDYPPGPSAVSKQHS